MFNRACRYVFLITIYLSGIAIGGVYTPKVITYAKHYNEQQALDQKLQQQIPKKQNKKRFAPAQQLG
jgi:hypothetical protein